MKIIIAGGTGFLGKLIASEFKNEEVVVFSRNEGESELFRTVKWDGKNLGNWQNELEGADVLINLTGKSINCRFSEQNKELILNSRVNSTRILGEALLKCQNRPKLWINASGAAIYKFDPGSPSTESSEIATDTFFQNVCKAWEEALYESALPNVRKVAIRVSIVLSKKEGALVPLMRLTKFGLGGRQGSGYQKFSWIHQGDFVKAVRFIIENEGIKGAVNMGSTNPVSNSELMKEIRKAIGVPFGIPSPTWMVRMGGKIIGVEADLILDDLYVFPQVLESNGFKFEFSNLSEALKDLIP